MGPLELPKLPVSREIKTFGEPRWLRALALHPSPVLFADVEPADACQGRVGNCWLIAAMSALAEFPSYFKHKVFITKKAELAAYGSARKQIFAHIYIYICICIVLWAANPVHACF